MVEPSNCVVVKPLHSYDWSLAHFGVLDFNPTVYCLVAGLFAVALWLVIDLTAQVHLTFRSYRGLYYYSILATTWGIAFHAIAFIVKLYIPGNDHIGTTFLAKMGWIMNTTGFSIVLYSRLNLVVQSRNILRIALTAIIVDALLLHTPIAVFSFGLSTPSYKFWIPYMSYMERIQIVGFTLQDLALSTIYTWTSAKLLNDRYTLQRRNLFAALLFAQTFSFVSDLAMVTLDFENMFTLKASLHPFIYAIKLKIEFLVLNQLVYLVQPNSTVFIQWGAEATTSSSFSQSQKKRDSVWSSKSRHEKDVSSNCCSQCQRLGETQVHRESLGAASAKSEVAVGPFTSMTTVSFATPPRRASEIVQHDPGAIAPDVQVREDQTCEDRSIKDLERQYLGKYRI